MTETRNSPTGNRNVVIKAGGAGGIGAVVLLGGALAAAAFASAFALRHKRRSSGEDSLPEINKKSENSKRGDEVVELENDSCGMISDRSSKLGDDANVDSADENASNVETADENDAVSDSDFVIVKEEFPMLAAKENFSVDHSKEGDDGDGGVIVARSSEEDVEEKEMQPRQEENSQECHHDLENNAVEEVPINQTKEFEGLSNVNGEINEEKCVEKTVLPQFEGHAVEQDNLVGEEEEVPLPNVGVEMLGVDNIEEKTVEEHKHVNQSDEGKIQIGGEAKQNHPLDDPPEVRGDKLMEGENGVTRDVYGKKDMMEKEAEEAKGVEKDEDRTGNMSKSKWEALWQEESRKEWYEVGGKIQEDRVEENNSYKMMKKEEGARRAMIWVMCVVSSLSCSWFLELSYAKLGLLVLLTVFMLEMYGYSLQKEVLAMTKHHTTDI